MALAGKGQAQGHAAAAATQEEATKATKATTATTTAHRAQLSVAPSIKAQTETK